MKKMILATAVVCITTFGNAQEMSMKNTIKIGALAGVSVPQHNTGASAGIDLAYQNLLTPHLGLGLATGYQHFFGRDNTVNSVRLDNNGFGVVPVAGLIRYYPRSEGVYLGTDLGYGVITGEDLVVKNNAAYNADMPKGGVYLKPELGYHNRHWNIYAHYTKVFTGDRGTVLVPNGSQKFNAGTVGLGLAYNIGLGAGRY